MRIFLVAGRSGSGKTDVAKYIKEYYIYKMEESVITGYSKYITPFCMELTDWDGMGVKPRRDMQIIAAELRKMDPKFFTRRMIQDMEYYESKVQNVIVSDCRMPEELDSIYDSFDEVYSIYVINQFGKSNLTLEEQADITETILENYDGFDYTIANDDQNTLKDKVFAILEGIK